MSKQKARRRAEERAKKRAPKTRDGAAATTAAERPQRPRPRAAGQKQGREAGAVGPRAAATTHGSGSCSPSWLVANAVICDLHRHLERPWLGLTITTILVPLIVWLVWDPERSRPPLTPAVARLPP